VFLILKLFMSFAPYLIQDAEQDQRQTAPNKKDFFQTIVSDYGDIVLDVWIAVEKLVSSAENEDPAIQEDKDGNSECHAQRRNAGLLNRRNKREYLIAV
jgi:hypothetical protein